MIHELTVQTDQDSVSLQLSDVDHTTLRVFCKQTKTLDCWFTVCKLREELYLSQVGRRSCTWVGGGRAGGVGVKGLEADRLVGFSSFAQANTDQRVRLLWDYQQLQNLQRTRRLEVHVLARTDTFIIESDSHSRYHQSDRSVELQASLRGVLMQFTKAKWNVCICYFINISGIHKNLLRCQMKGLCWFRLGSGSNTTH